MSEVFVVVTVEDFDGEEGSEPVVRVYGDPESARAAAGEARATNDYVALSALEVVCDG